MLKPKRKRKRSQLGQSLLEFALLAPIMVGMVQLLIQVNEAINVSIVNQKYTRGHLYHLFFNHPYYPELGQMHNKDNNTVHGRFWIGMDSQVVTENTFPIPPKVKVGALKVKNDDDPEQEAKARQNVHVKSAAFVCPAPFGVDYDRPFTEGSLGEDSFKSGSISYCTR